MNQPGLEPFSDRLCQAIKAKRTPLVVGLDPRWEQIPEAVRRSFSGGSLLEISEVFAVFCKEIIDVVAERVPAVKPQAAFFEELGSAGMVALEKVVDYAKSRNLIVIMDAKRGDIGSTAEAYARAFLGEKPKSPWGCDCLTVNPYLGADSLTPFVNTAIENSAGIFVLAKTSNPGSQTLQEKLADGKPVYMIVADLIQSLAAQSTGSHGFGDVGAVVGATYPRQLSELRARMPNTLFLVPGFGAQGGTARDVAGGFREDGLGSVINSSRGIIFAHESKKYGHLKDWTAAVDQATRDAISELAAETQAGRL